MLTYTYIKNIGIPISIGFYTLQIITQSHKTVYRQHSIVECKYIVILVTLNTAFTAVTCKFYLCIHIIYVINFNIKSLLYFLVQKFRFTDITSFDSKSTWVIWIAVIFISGQIFVVTSTENFIFSLWLLMAANWPERPGTAI